MEARSAFLGTGVLFLSFVLSGCAYWFLYATPTGGVPFETYEAEEDRRTELDLMGQKNCVPEAIERTPTSACPLVPTNFPKGFSPIPSEGIRILDSMYVLCGPTVVPSRSAGGSWPGGVSTCYVGRENAALPVRVFQNFNFQRSTGGLLPDILIPGLGAFFTYYGIWDDTNGDGILLKNMSSTAPQPQNEWFSLAPAPVVSFVEPGTHPALGDFWESREPFEPDFTYVPTTSCVLPYCYPYDYKINRGYTVFLTGSLFQSYVVRTVSEFSLGRDPENPYGLTPSSLVDIDSYLALSPTPLQPIYSATLGVLENGESSPTFGWCPGYECEVTPWRMEKVPYLSGTLRETGVAGAYEGSVGPLYARLPPEWVPGSESNGEGMRDTLNTTHVPWTDLVLMYVPWPSPVGAPLEGNTGFLLHPNLAWSDRTFLPQNPDGSPFMPPGTLVGEVWVGLFRDFNGDGFVGVASTPDPYENGTRPLADDYRTRTGEFSPGAIDPKTRCSGSFSTITGINITLIPDVNPGEGSDGWDDLNPVYHARGTPPPVDCAIVWNDAYYSVPGQYIFPQYVIAETSTLYQHLDLPFGSLRRGFTVCAGPVKVTAPSPTGDLVTFVGRDCDHVERADPVSWATWVAQTWSERLTSWAPVR